MRSLFFSMKVTQTSFLFGSLYCFHSFSFASPSVLARLPNCFWRRSTTAWQCSQRWCIPNQGMRIALNDFRTSPYASFQIFIPKPTMELRHLPLGELWRGASKTAISTSVSSIYYLVQPPPDRNATTSKTPKPSQRGFVFFGIPSLHNSTPTGRPIATTSPLSI